MKLRLWNRWQVDPAPLLYPKSGAVLSLILISILVIACGDTTPTTLPESSSGPMPTVTIQMNNNRAIPTPSPLWCGAWAPQTTPIFKEDEDTTVTINAKFVQNINGNPQGVAEATATATLWWSPQMTETKQVTTTNDGLAVFFFSAKGKAFALNRNAIATVVFDKPNVGTCEVKQDRAAFFTLVSPASPTATPCPDDKKNSKQCKDNKDNKDKEDD